MHELTIRKLAEYCRDYVDLVSPSAYARSDKKIHLPATIFSVEPLLNCVAGINYDDQLVLPIRLSVDVIDLSYENEETVDDISEQNGSYIEIALNLDDIQRKYETNSYTKQLSLQFGKISFSGFPILHDEDSSCEVDDRINMEGYLFSVPISLSYQDANGRRNYEVRIDDTYVKTNIGFLKNYMKLEYRDELYKFIAKDSNEVNSGIPVHPSYVDELWSKIITYLKFSEATEISLAPDMSDVAIVLEPKANYFLSQDLSGIIQTADDDVLIETSLSAWIDKDEKYVHDVIDDNGNHELFFPFDYDKYQLKVLSKIKNKGLIVEGPPGTGKSQTISNILVHLAALGNKVLFVSQKDQAVRGVKDKLKGLSIPCLFGYIPDRTSKLHTKEDERDSATYALRGIAQAHLDWVGVQDPKKYLAEIRDGEKSFNEQIAKVRGFVPMYEEWKSLEEFDFSENTERITKDWYKSVLAKRGTIDSLRKTIADQHCMAEHLAQSIENKKNERDRVLGKTEETRRHFREIVDYPWLQKEQDFLLELSYADLAEVTRNINDMFQKTALDRRGFLATWLSKWNLSKGIDGISHSLPLELYEAFKVILFSDATKTGRRIELDKIEKYFAAMSNFQELEQRTLVELRQLELKKEKCEGELGAAETLVGKENSELNCMMLDEISMARFEGLYQTYETSLFEKIHRRYILDHEIKNQINLNLNEVRQEIMRGKISYDSQVKNYIKNRVAERANGVRGTKKYRAALESIAWKLSKTKKAYKTFDNLKSDPFNFEAMSAVTPIWMMGLDDASRILPLQPNLFDYVIIDEASQCNISYTLPVMYRARHAVFFGDTLQMRDATIAFKSNSQLQSLAFKHSIPEEMQIKAEADSVKSVMDIAKLNGFETIVLKRHYRSPLEIIGFSNEHFYAPKNRKLEVVNDDILATNDGYILKTHLLQVDESIENSAKVNKTEAYFIMELIDKIKADERTKDKSIAVLSFFNEQAELLRQAIPHQDVKVSTIEGIQGDERDIVIFSFVISIPTDKKRYSALTGESGEIRKEINEGRVNVAFSRARLQIHAVTSLAPHLWPEGIWIKKYLQYIEEHGRVRRLSKAEQHFDSHFEEEVYDFLMQNLDLNDFRITTQVESCGFKIDQVITNVKSGKKLAIECDGPTHFEDGNGQVRVANDFERQYVLEMARWVFHRISYVEWQRDRDSSKKSLLDAIERHFVKGGQSRVSKTQPHLETYQREALHVKVPESFLEELEPRKTKQEATKHYRRLKPPKRSDVMSPLKQVDLSQVEHLQQNKHLASSGDRVIGSYNHVQHRDNRSNGGAGKRTKAQSSIDRNETGSNQLSIDDYLELVDDTKTDGLQQTEMGSAPLVKTLKGESMDFVFQKSIENVGFEDVVTKVQRAGIPFIDNRSKGGALWIIGGKELERFVKECEGDKVVFRFKAGGGRITKGKDAWWSK